jgi:Rod binding domain-containing protein
MSSFALVRSAPVGPGTIRSTGPETARAGGKDDETRLRKSALALEGLFVQRLFAAMRETVPDDGLIPQSNAEGTFTDMLDEKMAAQVPEQWSGAHSLAQALYNQLRQRVAGASADPSSPDSPR